MTGFTDIEIPDAWAIIREEVICDCLAVIIDSKVDEAVARHYRRAGFDLSIVSPRYVATQNNYFRKFAEYMGVPVLDIKGEVESLSLKLVELIANI